MSIFSCRGSGPCFKTHLFLTLVFLPGMCAMCGSLSLSGVPAFVSCPSVQLSVVPAMVCCHSASLTGVSWPDSSYYVSHTLVILVPTSGSRPSRSLTSDSACESYHSASHTGILVPGSRSSVSLTMFLGSGSLKPFSQSLVCLVPVCFSDKRSWILNLPLCSHWHF